jgi:hypothetical protein
LFKGIVSRNMYQLRPLVFNLGLNNQPRRYYILFSKSHAAKRYDASNRGTLDVKWQELEFSLLLSSALKCVLRIVTNKITLARIATVKSLNFRADCHMPYLTACIPATWARSLAIRSPIDNGLSRSYSCCANPRHLTAELSKWPNSSTRHFTSTVPLFDTSSIFDARLSRCNTEVTT